MLVFLSHCWRVDAVQAQKQEEAAPIIVIIKDSRGGSGVL